MALWATYLARSQSLGSRGVTGRLVRLALLVKLKLGDSLSGNLKLQFESFDAVMGLLTFG